MKTSATPRFGLVASALGVVFGDIGTSPLYAFQAALNASPETTREASLGVASLTVWSLLAIVTGKYVLLVMRADYKGEGGIFALLALLGDKDPPSRRLRLPFFMLLLMFGAARAGTRLFPLTQKRPKPAVPLGGKYRLVDIPISNCLNSGFRQVYFLTQFNSESLHRHIAGSYKFDSFTDSFTLLAANRIND